MFQIVLNGPGYLDTRYELPAGETLLGRADDNHIVLSGEGVSRHHARLIRERDRLRLEDLRSRNGTVLNGHRIVGSVPLRAGDRIEIGENQLTVEAMLATAGATTVVMQKPLDQMPTLARLRAAQALGGREALGAGEELESLALLSLVSERLARAPSLDVFLAEVADLVLELAKAQTVVVLLQDEGETQAASEGAAGALQAMPGVRRHGVALLHDTADASPKAKAAAEHGGAPGTTRTHSLVPAVIRHQGHRLQGQVPISWGIVHRCLSEQVALCVENVAEDPRFAGRESVVANGVQHAICVPLLDGERVVGVLYVDRAGDDAGLSGLLEALTAVAHLAASGIERQRLQDRVEREARVRRRLARFLAPDVVDDVLRERGGGLGMEERIATVLFADISGFTAFAEKAPAMRVVSLLDEFYRRMTASVFEHRGTVDKFIGDAVMAVFGAPYARIDDAERALLTALAMQDSFEELMAGWAEEERCHLKIGLCTGRLLAGTVGGDRLTLELGLGPGGGSGSLRPGIERLEYTAVGDTVNVASRLVGEARPGQILASSATIEAGGSRFDAVALGERILRGRSEPVSVFELRGLVPAAAPSPDSAP